MKTYRYLILSPDLARYLNVYVFFARAESISKHVAELLRVHRLTEWREGLAAFPIVGIRCNDSSMSAVKTQFGEASAMPTRFEEIERVLFRYVILEVELLAIYDDVDYLVLIVMLLTPTRFVAITSELDAIFFIPYLSRVETSDLLDPALELVNLPVITIIDSCREQQAEVLGIVLFAGY